MRAVNGGANADNPSSPPYATAMPDNGLCTRGTCVSLPPCGELAAACSGDLDPCCDTLVCDAVTSECTDCVREDQPCVDGTCCVGLICDAESVTCVAGR